MARFNLQTGDLIGQFLPDVIIKRITIEDYLDDHTFINKNKLFVDQGATNLEIDLEIKDVMDKEVERLVARAVDEGLRRAVPAVSRPERSGEELIDAALKIGVIICSGQGTDEAIKRLLRQQGGRGLNWGDRWKGSVLNPRTGEPLQNPSVGEVLRLINVGDFQDDQLNLQGTGGTVKFLEAPARSLNSEQYTEAAYELMGVRDISNNLYYVLPHTFKQRFSRGVGETVSVFAFTFMDFSIFDIDLSAEERAFLNNLYGTVRYVKVLEDGKVVSTSRIFLDNTGTPWTGPYHQMRVGRYGEDSAQMVSMSGRFMKGRFHDSDKTDASQYLTPIMVPNYKVQDFRSFSRAEQDSYLPATMPSFLRKDLETEFLQERRTNQFNSRLDLMQDPDLGHIFMEFTIDQEYILENYSKFSNLYKNLKGDTRYSSNIERYKLLLPRNTFRLVTAKVKRRRVTRRNIGINRLGMPAPDVFDKEEPDFIVGITGEPHPDAESRERGMDYNATDLLISAVTSNGEVLDDSFENIQATAVTRDMADFLRGRGDGSVPVDSGLPFPFYRKILAIDKSLTNIYDGRYQYGIELIYEDPIEKLLKEILVSLKEARQQLQEYYNESTIPVFSTQFKMNVREEYDPAVHGELPDEIQEFNERFGLDAETVVFGSQIPRERGSYNVVRKTFESSFIERAKEKYNFELIANAYVSAFNLVIADSSFRIGNLPESLRNDMGDETTDIGPGSIRRLIQPEGSRPEQILSVLNAYISLEELLEDLVDIDLIKDASNVQLTPGEAGSRGRAPHLIRVERWFSGAHNYVNTRDKLELNMRFLPPEQSPAPPPEPDPEPDAVDPLDGYLSIVESESKDGVIRRLRLRTQDHYRFLDPNPQQRNLVEIQLDIHIRAIEAAGDDREVATLFKQYVDLLRRLGRNY
tara:strand:- start:776 stop:3532 length:2757 start_codon:yes stop_codon:yes gene_type:complete